MSHNNTSATRSNAARNNTRKNTAASQQVANTQTQGTPVPAKLEDLESRLSEYNTALSDAKKKSQKASENLAKARDLYENERYCVAVCRKNQGKASAEDLALVNSRKAEENATAAIAKAMDAMPKDTDDVAKARDEYFRDARKGLGTELHVNYFPDDDPYKKPLLEWRAHSYLLYSNWLNYYVYQLTPYDLNEIH